MTLKTIQIIFENEHFLCAFKPKAMLSVPSRYEDNDERPVLGRFLEKQLRRTMYPVHRLDFEVSGLILFAKNKTAQMLLNQGFEHKQIQKKYAAITSVKHQFVPSEKMYWRSRLAKGKKRAFIADHGKISETSAIFHKEEDGKSIFWLWPITGRSHQLRFEMFHHAVAIDGDVLYGSEVKNEEGILLESIEIDFSNFKNREKVEAPIFLKNTLA